MIKKKISIPLYKWDCLVIIAQSKDDAGAISKELRRIHLDGESLREMEDELSNGGIDGGLFMYNQGRRSSAIIINPCSTDRTLFGVLSHEARHLTDEVLEHAGVKDMEASAYLTEHIMMEMYDILGMSFSAITQRE